MTAAAAERQLEVLLFEVDGRRYALPSALIRELVWAVTIVPLPKAPPIVEGVINVRGTVVAVLDIRSRFRLSPKPLEHTDHFALAWAGPRLVAVRADRALDLVRLDAAQVEDAKVSVPGAEYVAGVAKLPEGLILIHDLETFLSEAEAEALGAAISRDGGGR